MCIYQAVTLVYSWSQICENYVSTMILNEDTRAWVTTTLYCQLNFSQFFQIRHNRVLWFSRVVPIPYRISGIYNLVVIKIENNNYYCDEVYTNIVNSTCLISVLRLAAIIIVMRFYTNIVNSTCLISVLRLAAKVDMLTIKQRNLNWNKRSIHIHWLVRIIHGLNLYTGFISFLSTYFEGQGSSSHWYQMFKCLDKITKLSRTFI